MAQFNSVSVGTTPIEVAAANGMRRSIAITNRGSADVYLGSNASVAVGVSSVLRPQESLSMDKDPDAYWAVAASGTQQVDVIEVSS